MATSPLTSTPGTMTTMTVSSSRSSSPSNSSTSHSHHPSYTHPNIYQPNHHQHIVNPSPHFHDLTQSDESLAFESSSPRPHDLSPVQSQCHLVVGQTEAPGQHSCMWANCHSVYGSLQDLVAHVNVQHLRTASASSIANNQPTPSQDPIHQSALNSAAQAFPSCHWGDCHVYPTVENVPGSSDRPLDAALGVLAAHLWEYHFGLPTPPPHFTFPSAAASAVVHDAGGFVHSSSLDDVSPKLQTSSVDVERMDMATEPVVDVSASSQALGSVHSPTQNQDHTHDSGHDCATADHPCKWLDCQERFASCEELMTHITAGHVGGGKNHYGCFWDGCGRNGENGFKSKQKICRHLQVRLPSLAMILADLIPPRSHIQDTVLINARFANSASQRLRHCSNTCGGTPKRVRIPPSGW